MNFKKNTKLSIKNKIDDKLSLNAKLRLIKITFFILKVNSLNTMWY